MSNKITVIGNVVNSPSRNRTQNGSVTNFRVAASERRFDSETQAWVDGHTFFVDVECWGELGGNVSHSISKGDPVVVVGSIRTHEWDSDQGRRSRPQIKAEAVAPNLARGVAEFRRTQRQATAATGEPRPVEDASDQDHGPGQDVDRDDLAGLIAGRDYEVHGEELSTANADLEPEPVHV